jgi:hypothetical protein
VARDHDNRQRLVCGLQPLQHFEAVHAGHLDVEQHEVWQIAVGDDQPVLPGRGALHLVAFVLENHLQRVADRRLVIDHQDAWFHVGSPMLAPPYVPGASI